MWKWRLLLWLLRNLSRSDDRLRKRLRGLQTLVQGELDQFVDEWVTHCVRPKVPCEPVEICETASRIAIVIQGQIVTEDDFTRQTILYYRQTFPDCPIFVSTWNTEEAAVVDSLIAAGATVLQSEPPAVKAPSHLNYQICSTLAGLRAAEEAGCEYVLKTRADARIYGTNVADFLVGLIDQFPVQGTRAQRGRLAILDCATRMFIPHHPADILMFGYTADMINYWDTPLCLHPKSAERPPCWQFGDLVNSVIPEVYLCQNYLQRIGYDFEPTIDSWWQCLADLFVVVDRTAIEHFWFKYNYAQEHRSTPDAHLRNEALCTFRDWLGIMNFRKSSSVQLEELMPHRPSSLIRQAA
jgi:hypothetical protein